MPIADDIRVRQTFDPTGENGGYKFESGLKDKSDRLIVEDGTGVEGANAYLTDLPWREVNWIHPNILPHQQQAFDLLRRNMTEIPKLERSVTGRWRWKDWEKGVGQSEDRLNRKDTENPCSEIIIQNFTKVERRILDYCESDAKMMLAIEEKARFIAEKIDRNLIEQWNEMLRIEE